MLQMLQASWDSRHWTQMMRFLRYADTVELFLKCVLLSTFCNITTLTITTIDKRCQRRFCKGSNKKPSNIWELYLKRVLPSPIPSQFSSLFCSCFVGKCNKFIQTDLLFNMIPNIDSFVQLDPSTSQRAKEKTLAWAKADH